MSDLDSKPDVAAVRAFNRFYTRKLGVLDQQLLKSPFSLSEARVLYELAQRQDISAKEIGAALGLDAGYLSRIVQNFDEAGLISRETAADRPPAVPPRPTAQGRQAFAKLERSTNDDIAAMLDEGCRPAATRAWLERWPTSSGCWAMAVPRHGQRRCASRAPATWDGWCRAMASSTRASLVLTPRSRRWSPKSWRTSSPYDPTRERCWIAEIDGAPVGSIFLVRHTDDVANWAAADRPGWSRAAGSPPDGRRMHRVREGMRLSQDHAVDPEHSGRRARDLSTGRLKAGRHRAAPQFWSGLTGETWELEL